MTVVPVVDPATGSVALAPETLTVLRQYAADPAAAAPGADQQLDLLARAGLIDANGVIGRLGDALATIVDPAICTVELHQSGKVMEGWVDSRLATLLLPPANDSRRTLKWVHPSLLPEALARLVDLGPRTRAVRAEPLQLSAAGLERLLEGDAATAGEVLGASAPTSAVAAATSLGSSVRRRWRLCCAWSLEDGESGRTAIEVVDSDDGIWLLEGEKERLIAWPVTPTVIWRLIVRMLMRRGADGQQAVERF